MKLILTCFALCLALCVTGCNTIGGVGEDLKAAGGAIENTAKKAKDKISQ